MNQENKTEKNYPWELLDASTLLLPEEIITYHLYRYEMAQKNKRSGELSKETQILSNYIQNNKKKEMEVEECFQK